MIQFQFANPFRLGIVALLGALFTLSGALQAQEKTYKLPDEWIGETPGETAGNPYLASGKARWRLDQVWPENIDEPKNYAPMIWKTTAWKVKEHTQGGQPAAKITEGNVLELDARGSQGDNIGMKIGALVFIAPETGQYLVEGGAKAFVWQGSGPIKLVALKIDRAAGKSDRLSEFSIEKGATGALEGIDVFLKTGEELVLVPQVKPNTGLTLKLRGFKIVYTPTDKPLQRAAPPKAAVETAAPVVEEAPKPKPKAAPKPAAEAPATVAAPAANPGLSEADIQADKTYKLPDEWTGETPNETAGNPFLAGGKPRWRLDQVWPENIEVLENYAPLIWKTTGWKAKEHTQGGQPAAKIEEGNALSLDARGSQGDNIGMKIAALVFIAPEKGQYFVVGNAKAMVWQGGGPIRLVVLKIDRNSKKIERLSEFSIEKGATAPLLGVDVFLEAGQELVLVPQVKSNTGLTLKLRGLKVLFTATDKPLLRAAPKTVAALPGAVAAPKMVENPPETAPKTPMATGRAVNVVRNGSFEGSAKYWLTTGTPDAQNPAFGSHSLKVSEGTLASTPFPLKVGEAARVSLSIRAATAGNALVKIQSAKRDEAQAGFFKSEKTPVSTEWKRVSFLYTPKKADTDANWMLLIDAPQPFWVDGVTVGPDAGADSAAAFSPRRDVEIAAEATDLPGIKNNANLLAPGAKVTLRATVSNQGTAPKNLTLRWQLLDYTGTQTLGAPVEKKVVVAPGKIASESVPMTLTARGLMLARVSVLDESGAVLDASEQPLTVLPFPKAATSPNPEERIGASYRSVTTAKWGRAVGFGWSRWFPTMDWSAVQPDGPNEWKWPDETLNTLFENGMSVDMVLYGTPKWARGDKYLPADMLWKADDPKWDDLTVQTGWDKFVTAAVTRYKDKPIAWEFVNEPEFRKWEPAVYFAFAKRTARVMKAANPNATFIINNTEPTPSALHLDFFKRGGGHFTDVYSWHNYGTGPMGGRGTIRTLQSLIKSGDTATQKAKTRIWFNEGGTFIPGSQDYAAYPLGKTSPSDFAHLTVRSMSDMFAAGAEKHIMFHIAYQNGRTPWDWLTNGGTELWDEMQDPTIGVATWNVLIDSLGLSDPAGVVKADGATLNVFQDKRNKRGVAVVYATDGAKTLQLPLAGLVRRDVMGNDEPLKTEGGKTKVELPADGRPFYLFSTANLSGADLVKALAPLNME